MKNILDLHLSSAAYADTKDFKIAHCQVVSFLVSNFFAIKSGELDFQDYTDYCNVLGVSSFIEENFEIFKSQAYY